MTILLFDESAANCNAVARLLSGLGLRCMRSQSALEASHLYLDHLATVRMIICDMDSEKAGRLKSTIRANSSAGILPMVGTTSDPSKFRGRTSTLLRKPFGHEQLRYAMANAWASEVTEHTDLIWAGTDETNEDFQRASAALASGSLASGGFAFRKLVPVSHPRDWKQAIQMNSRKIGGVIIHPRAREAKIDALMFAYRSSPLGLVLPWISLSRSPEEVRSLWKIADSFLDLTSDLNWREVLARMSAQLRNFWEVRRLSQGIRGDSGAARHKATRSAVNALLEIEPWSAVTNSAAGTYYLSTGDMERGKLHLSRTIQVNPGLSAPYFQLYSATDDPSETRKLDETAAAYCPPAMRRNSGAKDMG